MVKDPINFFEDVYSFLNLNMNEKVAKLIKDLTTNPSVTTRQKNKKKVNPYAIYRDSKSVSREWREGLTWPEIEAIQTECKDAMRLWGYEELEAPNTPKWLSR